MHNECFARRKVQRTYGKKGKASAALLGTQDFLKMTNELEKKLAAVSIFEDNESDGKENEEKVELVSDKKLSDTERKETTNPEKKTSSEKTTDPDKAANSKKTAKSRKTTKPRKTANPKKTAKPEEQAKREASSSHSDHNSIFDDESETADFSGTTLDHEAITNFVEKHSDHGILCFKAYGKTIDEKYDVKKIGEGTFSHAFALTKKTVAGSTAGENSSSHRKTIIKLMPVALPSQKVYSGMTELSDVANEVQILEVMDPIHGFIRYRGVVVVKGLWPESFLKAFKDYAKHFPDQAQHDEPKDMFDATQHFALIEMEDAGSELNGLFDNNKRTSVFQIYDIFWSACIHLANAENRVQFEHRDMHVSNICVKPADPAIDRLDVEESTVAEMKKKPRIILGMSNIAITMIDYTYSRLTLSHDIDPERRNIFRDFTPENNFDDAVALFEIDTPPSEKEPKKLAVYFEAWEQDLAYAKVAKCVDTNFDKAARELGRDKTRINEHLLRWEHHLPQTNVCWLSYLLTVLLVRNKFACDDNEYVSGSNEVARRVQNQIRKKLLALEECVKEPDLDKMPKSAGDIVRIGLENQWLGKSEIQAFKARLERDS